MKRAAIYARYSSEAQNPTSIADQIALCGAHATRQGWAVVGIYEEPAISGANAVNRPAYLRLVAAAERVDFDIVLVEDVSRLTRDTAELLGLYKRLAFRGVAIVGVSDGIATGEGGSGPKIHLAIKGLVNDLYLDDLREKTHRGQSYAFERGCSTGGKLFGYRTTPVAGGGVRFEVDDQEAELVRRIFRDYVAGASQRMIAFRLNAERVPFPTKDTKRGPARIGWALSSIQFILRNEKYIGRWVWNRTMFVKDPATGRRRPRPRPESEWKRLEVPELRLVDDELWHTAQARVRSLSRPADSKPAYSPYLLTGLLRCGECGSRMQARTQTRRKAGKVYRQGWYYCGFAVTKGPDVCKHRSPYRQDHLEGAIADQLRAAMSPAMIGALVARVNEGLAAVHAADTPLLEALRSERRALGEKAGHLISFLAGGDSSMVREELRKIEKRIRELDGEAGSIERRMEAAPRLIDAGWITSKLEHLYRILLADPVAAKAEIAKHLQSDLRIEPVGERRAEISGAVDPHGLLREGGRVAIDHCGGSHESFRDGLPLLTFRFSVLRLDGRRSAA